MDKNLLAGRIRQYRHMAKMTQEALADKTGASDIHIRKIEAGERLPSLELLTVIATVLNTTPDRLLLPVSVLSQPGANSFLALLSDCTPTEYAILYENMLGLKALLRTHLR